MTSTEQRRRAVNPYVGPNPIQFGEPIFGRDREITDLLDTLVSSRIVLFYSPSGAGKSSLINAGLRPALAEREFAVVPTVRVGHDIDPGLGNRYLLSTLQSLEEVRAAAESRSPAELADLGLSDYLAELRDLDHTDRDVCLVFDQFEELFTLDPTDQVEKRAFVTELGKSLRDRSTWALFSMREDYIAQLDPYLPLIPTRLASRYRLDLLEPDAAMAAARYPAVGKEVDFAEAAATRLVDNTRVVRVRRGNVVVSELGPYVEPVVLQVVCQRLWERMEPSPGDTIETGDIDEVGDVDDALTDFCDAQIAHAAATSDASELQIRSWIDSDLVGEQGFRLQVLHGPDGTDGTVVPALADGHFLRSERRRGTNWYEIAHDRLVGPVTASNERWREGKLARVQEEADRWLERNRTQTLLLRGEILTEAQEWATAHPDEVRDLDAEFLESSETQRRRRRLMRRRLMAAEIGILFVLLVWVIFANRAATTASKAEQDALLEVISERQLLGVQLGEAQADAADTERQLQESQVALDDATTRVSVLEAQLQAVGETPDVPSTSAMPTTPPTTAGTLAPEALDDLLTADEAAVDSVAEQWVPQLSAKTPGIVWMGITFGYEEILEEHLGLRDDHGAVLVDGATYNFMLGDTPMDEWYITLVPEPFEDPDDALAWCEERSLDRDNCFAKFLSEDRTLEDTTRLQS